MPPAHPCHSWLQCAKPARRTSWKRQILQDRIGFTPSSVPCVAKAKEGRKEGGKWFCGHGLTTTEQWHCKEDPHSCPLAMCIVPGINHSLRSDTAQQFHIIMWRKECLPDPTSFFTPASWPTCIPWAPGATRIWPRWLLVSKPVSFLHPACICTNVTITAVKFRAAPCKENKCINIASLCPAAGKNLKIFPAVWERGQCMKGSLPALPHGSILSKRTRGCLLLLYKWSSAWKSDRSPLDCHQEVLKKKDHSTKTTRAFLPHCVPSPRYLFTTNLKILLSTSVSPEHSQLLGHEGHWETFFS